MRKLWKDCQDMYMPAAIGAFCLAVADILQNDRNGQIVKVGGALKRVFAPQADIDPLLGLTVVLLLGIGLCWVFRPQTRPDAFTKGASVFAVLAALIPAQEPPGTSLGPQNGRPTAEPLAPRAGLFAHAHAQMVIAPVPLSNARIRISFPRELQADGTRRMKQDGLHVWLIDPTTGEQVAFERIHQSQFTISKPPKRYILEVELSGFRRVRLPLHLREEPQAYELRLEDRSVLPSGIQRLLPAAAPQLTKNENESLKLRGAEAARRGDFAAALVLYDQALALAPLDRETLNYKGYALFRLQRYEQSFQVLTSAHRLEPAHFLVRLNLAKASCRLGRQQDALEAIFGAPSLSDVQLKIAAADGEFFSACREIGQKVRAIVARSGELSGRTPM